MLLEEKKKKEHLIEKTIKWFHFEGKIILPDFDYIFQAQ